MVILSLFSLCIGLFTSTIHTSPYCMDKSLYGNITHGYDYKKYHYVDCTCPCERYPQSYKRGICERCLHPKKPLSLHHTAKPLSSNLQEYETQKLIYTLLHKKRDLIR